MAVRIVEDDNKDKDKEITLKCTDFDGEIEKLLNHIKKISDYGHTFDVVVCPGEESEMSFEIDGDGPTHINDILVK